MKGIYPIILLICLTACGGADKIENESRDTIFTTHAAPQKTADTISRAQAPDAVPPPDTVRQAPTPPNPYATSNIEVRTFQNHTNDDANGTWGYDIYIDDAMRFHQPNIPAVAGIRGFRSESDAHKTGNLAAYKIKHNITPPTITVQELDSIAVIH